MAGVDAPPLVRTTSVRKRFGGAVAVESASLELHAREIHALVGENGAGKSTLLKMVAGALRPDAGTVEIDGAKLAPHDVREAGRRGVQLVWQHFMLVPSLSALDNLALGAEPTKGPFGILDRASLAARATALMDELGLPVRLDAPVAALGVGERQRLEIVRVLLRGARAVLLDEPTAILVPDEIDRLYAVLRGLADAGKAVAVVTHHPHEVSRFADRVTVLRRGKVVRTGAVPREDLVTAEARAGFEDDLVRSVMGRAPPATERPVPIAEDAPVVLRASGVRAGRGTIEIDVRRGEVVGVAGIEGSGQVELVRAIAGLDPEGSVARVTLEDDASDPGSNEVLRVRSRRANVGVVHGDRHQEGLVLDATVHDNLVLGELGTEASERARVKERIERFQVEPRDPSLPVKWLSGGNQQKVVVGRALGRVSHAAAPVLVLLHPTRGIDVGAQLAVRRAISEAAAGGAAVLVLSSDTDELRALAHRIVVLEGGRVAGELPAGASDQEIGRLMLGAEAV